MTIGERIRVTRKNKGLTQIEVAQKAGIAVNSLRLYESGKRMPNLGQIQAIADALGGDVIYLISEQTTEELEHGILIDAEAEAREKLKKLQAQTENRSYEERLSLNESVINVFNLLKELNCEGRRKALENIEIIAGNPRYQYAKLPDRDK